MSNESDFWNIRSIFSNLENLCDWEGFTDIGPLKDVVDQEAALYLTYDVESYLEGSNPQTTRDLVLHMVHSAVSMGDMIVEGAEPKDLEDKDDFGIEGFELPKPSVTEDMIITREMVIGMLLMTEYLLVDAGARMLKSNPPKAFTWSDLRPTTLPEK